MRVITGTARGRALKTLDGQATRPTASHIKESIFNIIQFQLEGRRVLDLFAGCGQLGIEALSRGAGETVFVDNNPAACAVIEQNLTHCRLTGRVVRGDAAAFLNNQKEGFDVVFLDPPYGGAGLSRAVESLVAFDILREGGIIVCECEQSDKLPEVAPPYHKGREYRYGRQKITLYYKKEEIL